MSLPTHYLQRRYKGQLRKSADPHNKKPAVITAAYLLVFGSAAVVLSGCQTSPTPSKNASQAMIDFNKVDSAQGSAFNAQLLANDQRYQQLFDQTKYPNSESQAKSRLLSAIRQHLAGEQVAVAQAHYQVVPFTKADSIDTGSSSLLRTMIELYAYKNQNSADYSDSDSDTDAQVAEARAELEAAQSNSCNDSSNDDAYEVCVVDSDMDYAAEAYTDDEAVEAAQAAVAAAVAAINSDEAELYDADGFNQYGYDQDGYDREGYDQDGYNTDGYDYQGYDYDGYDVNGFDNRGLDEYGYDKDGVYGDNSDEEDSSASSSRLGRLNPKGLLRDYEAMQIQKQQAATQGGAAAYDPFAGMIGIALGMLQRTPEQVEAMNAYQYKHLTFNSVSHYQPKQKQLQSVYSYDYSTPTLSSSVQIPLAIDFNNSRITIDPSALLPLVALVNPEHTPLPEQMSSHTVNFGLPETITSQLPSAVIYDAVIAAIPDSMAELSAENFSAVDIRDDAFAKEVGAERAVKVYFGSQQSGEMIGKMLKYVSRSLARYVEANPDKYTDDAALKKAINKIQLYNKGYQSADVGALLQLIEAIGPISFNQVTYYYLDRADRLLAKQQTINIGGDLMGARTAVLNQIRYDQASFNQHALTPLLAQSFGPNSQPAMDGNAWLTSQRQRTEQLRQARYARYSYDDDSTYETTQDYIDAVDAVKTEDADISLDSQ